MSGMDVRHDPAVTHDPLVAVTGWTLNDKEAEPRSRPGTRTKGTCPPMHGTVLGLELRTAAGREVRAPPPAGAPHFTMNSTEAADVSPLAGSLATHSRA